MDYTQTQTEDVVIPALDNQKVKPPTTTRKSKRPAITYVNKELENRSPAKVFTRSQKLHFLSAKTFLESLQKEEYTIHFQLDKKFGFHEVIFTDKAGNNFTTVTVNIHFHHLNLITDEEIKKNYLIPARLLLDATHADFESLTSQQSEEEKALLDVRQILSTMFSLFAKEFISNEVEVEVEQHEVTELDKFRIKLPRQNFAADKILELMTNCDVNHDLCIQFIGGWVMPNSGKASKTGISFKLLPWLHQWYYFPNDPEPNQDAPKPKRAKRSPKTIVKVEEDSVA